ncbi:peptidoglycan editing factor PgeF [Paracoccus sp. MC1862]|uniref:peptidoglycan editing factor PgeF n=1 Tax=Paracoccus sp. MC1862 TaxID=2760307 RepID=UPI001600F3A8|nr:peptidoglycan editing factor PgeF [Paracoccus sp. MC1862]MBB1498219.1 peptidoglycan editing factor PgeF [Paracoccus sp. MC1862]QQO45710.1 peptidoglycan editing factor PgeF [Paracoccus sp. MC1862]
MTLEILTHPSLQPIRHGFFTRKGGASSGLFSGLNCGRGSTDQRDMVAINRARVAEALGVGPDRLATVYQTHSAQVVTLTEGDDLEAVAMTEADAIVSTIPGIAIAVLTADCQPILFADPEAGVIAAAHAGWKGALDGILQETVAAMKAAGATDIRAVIGPCISQRAYEVGEDFMDRFLTEDDGHARFFAGGPNGRPMFDLPGFGLSVLRDLEVEAEWTRHCTYSDPDRFFSYRRSTHEGAADYGRLLSAITL